jgi:hypothetical protein
MYLCFITIISNSLELQLSHNCYDAQHTHQIRKLILLFVCLFIMMIVNSLLCNCCVYIFVENETAGVCVDMRHRNNQSPCSP